MRDLVLIPNPRTVTHRDGVWRVPAGGTISLNFHNDALRKAVAAFRGLLPGSRGKSWRIAALDEPLPGISAIHLRLDSRIKHPQGYELRISEDGVRLVAATPQGLFYALMTLTQIARQCGTAWPALEVRDEPVLARRGFYHDISRGKVPKLATILQLVADLAALKINEFQLYIENVFEFQRHPGMYDDTTPLTAEEILEIDAACRERFIDFVPSLTSLGHFEKILRRPQYRHLAEAEPAELKQQGLTCWSNDPWSLCVTDPAAKTLLAEMYDEYLPNFSSPQFNICCDESSDLATVRSKVAAQAAGGAGHLYVDWIKYCTGLAARHGKRVQLWGDIILKYPDLIRELPTDVVVLQWGYEFDHPFARDAALFAASGRSFYVCPGTSSWTSFAGRTTNAFGNMRAAADAAVAHHAAGYLNTDWGDGGHQQMLAVSYLPMAFGAAVSWNPQDTDDQRIIAAAGLHVFRSVRPDFARAVARLGDVCRGLGRERVYNTSLEFQLFREPWDQTQYLDRVKPAALKPALQRCQELRDALADAVLQRPDGRLIRDEMVFSADCILHALRRTQMRLLRGKLDTPGSRNQFRALSENMGKLAREFKRLWSAPNKLSRVHDPLSHFLAVRKEYWQHMSRRNKPRAAASPRRTAAE